MESVFREIEANDCWFHIVGSLVGICGTIIRSLLGSGAVFPINGRLRDELLNETLFSSLAEARWAITDWMEDYSNHRLHSALGNVPPAEFAMKIRLEKQAA